ncbi:MAG: hypothetical protein IKN81_00195 [Oscillospiraceae bacterium]|nr:hypothetical protein [Oscillospiraceae bacterium]
MRTWKEKTLSAILSVVMLLSLIPTTSIPVRAAVAMEKPDIDVTDTGKYFDAGIGTGASAALIVNGAFGDNPTIGRYNGKLEGGGKREDISTYNMMNCFGIYRKGATVSAATAGFSRNNGQSINWGGGQYCDTLNVATYNNDGGSNGWMRVTIADNPTLKTLAKSGGLQVYFNGYACAGKEARKAWPDDHTYVYGSINISSATADNGARTSHSSGKAKDEKKQFGTGGWVTLTENSVITISWSVSRSSGKFSNGWADKDVGIGDSVMLFRKVACPNIADYTLTANGDYSVSGGHGAEVLLGNDGRIQLDMNVTLEGDTSKSDVVVSSLGGKTVTYSDDYNLLLQLGKRVLFKNTEGTGYERQGEPVYMKLTSADVLSDTNVVSKNIADSDTARLNVLQGGISSLHYEWNASEGDYYGNHAIPGEGDWAGLVSSSNALNLIDSIVLASFHDLAGNPLKLHGKLVPYQKNGSNYITNLQYEPTNTYEEGLTYIQNANGVFELVVNASAASGQYYKKRNVLPGTVVLNNTTKYKVANPFAPGSASDAGFGFVINAVTPTYSRSTNAVQPDILTRMTLNYGDSFDIALNFSEIVKLREFKPDPENDGKTVATGYAPENLYLELNNGLRARYKSGMGTRQLIFTVNVPNMYTLTVAQPETWDADCEEYYTKNGDTYTKVTKADPTGPAPAWEPDKYYSFVGDVTGTDYLEIKRMYVEDTSTHTTVELEENPSTGNYKTYNGGVGSATYSVANDYILTDYVGNPVCEQIGKEQYNTTMAWAKLQMDNTKPQVTITQEGNGDYKINVTDTGGSGVFHIDNATQGNNSASGVAYYVWASAADADEVSKQFTANNFEKVKRFSLAPSDDDKVVVNGTTYRLSPVSAENGIVPKKTEEGVWVLLVFASDMTWDSARQMIQYGKQNYLKDPTGYLGTLANELQVEFDDMFEEVAYNDVKDTWASDYHTYYYKNDDGTFSNISKGVEYPEWKENTYFSRAYTPLTEKPGGWDPYQEDANGTLMKLSDGRYVDADTNYTGTKYKFNEDSTTSYTNYYTLKDGAYVPVKQISGVPEFKENTYYGYDVFTDTVDSSNAANVYVRDTDSDGGAKYTSAQEAYAPAFVENSVYNNKVLVTTKPNNWSTTYTNYQYGANEYKPFSTWKSSATIAANKYYTRSDTAPYYTPVDGTAWKADYETGTYYVKEGNDYIEATVTPVFAPDKYYSVNYVLVDGDRVSGKDPDTGADKVFFKSYDDSGVEITENNSSVLVDWEDVCTDYYTESGGVYTQVADGAKYVENTYYRAKYTPLTSDTNWASIYQNCFTREVEYTPVTAEFPKNTEVTYYDKTPKSIAEAPDDWSTAYYYYSTTSKAPNEYTPLQWVSAPEWTAGTYYTFGFTPYAPAPKEMTNGLPTGWVDNYMQFYVNQGTEQNPNYLKAEIDTAEQKTLLESKSISIVSAAPSFDGFKNGVYKAKGASDSFVTKLAEKVDDNRKAAFTEQMLSAFSAAAKIEVIRGYSAFVNEVYAADVEFMAKGSSYTNWNSNDYSKNDSNWVRMDSAVNDVLSPTVDFGTLSGDGTEKVTIPVTVADNSAHDNVSGVKTVKYQFVTEENVETITVATTDNWRDDIGADKTSFSVTTPDNYKTGNYYLCVYAEDDAGNKTVSKQLVKIDSALAIEYTLTNPNGEKPYKELTGLSATFYGKAYGKDIFERNFKVYAVIDDNATKAADATGWDVIEGEAAADVTKDEVTYAAKSYTMPEKRGVSGYYYLHIKYTYDGMKEAGLINKYYWLQDDDAQITINQIGSDDDGIRVEITASGASTIEYAVTATDAAQSSVVWAPYSEAIKILATQYSDAARVWARVDKDDTTVRSANFMLNGSNKPTGILAEPDVKLLDVVEEGSKRYAIVYFDDLGDAMSVGAEYSVAVTAQNASTDSYVWQRWMPLDNTVKVLIGTGDVRLTFKFRNGDALTESGYRTLDVAADAVGTDEPWTVATRSTLRVVNGATGVTLNMQHKDTPTTKKTVNANGVYEQSGFQAAVSNINNNPPTYSIVWSDEGDHIGENGARATSVSAKVISDENITVTGLTFTQEGSATATKLSPSASYLFKKNGTAVFTIKNEAGTPANVNAKVTWLDDKAWNLTVKADKTNFRTSGSVSNGTRLVVTSNKELVNLEISGQNVTDEMGLDVYKNGVYQVSATNRNGQLVTKKIVVRNIVSTIEAPKQISTSEIDADGKVTVTIQGTAATNNPVYDGRVTEGATPLTLENGVYTITKTYSNNGTYTEYVTDSVGNTASYQVTVSKFDHTAPVIELKEGGVIAKNKTDVAEDEATWQAWIKSKLDVTDDKTATDKIAVTLTGSVDTSRIGAYSVLVKAKDASENTSYLRMMVYIMPTSGMIVTDENGVLFCSQSKDAALVNRNGDQQVVLQVSNYDLVKLTNVTVQENAESAVNNTKATIDVVVKQGAFREGQMKYFGKVATGKVTYNANRTATITLDVKDLPGTGWYTVLIRNSEREREFTTFFINANN